MKKRVIQVILSCKTVEQLRSAINHAALANLANDPLIEEWLAFKRERLKY
jgi:hypothetical protein